MIHFYVHHEGRIRKVTDASGITDKSDIVWIDLHEPTAQEDADVEKLLGINVPTREDMQEIELSSRVYNDDGVQFMTTLAVRAMPLEDPETTPVTFILLPDILVTVRYADLNSFSIYEKEIVRKGVTTAQLVMFDLLEIMIDRIADKIEDLGAEIDAVSKSIFHTRKTNAQNKTEMLQNSIRKIGEKGDLLSMLRESLAGMSRLLSHHNAEVHEQKPARTVIQKLNTMNRDVVSLNEHASFLSGKMAFLLDATLGMINLEQNRIIKIFSVAAVIFLPPTLVASIYGMNFRYIPELSWIFGYPMALCMMVLSAILPFVYFKKKGWL